MKEIKILVIDTDVDRGAQLAMSFALNAFRWGAGTADSAKGPVSIQPPVILLCHSGGRDPDRLKEEPLNGWIINGDAVVIYYGGGGAGLKNSLLQDGQKEVIRRDIPDASSGCLTRVEALELLEYGAWLLDQRTLPVFDQLERKRPEFLRRVSRAGFLRALRILCEGFVEAPPQARERVRTVGWWRQGLGTNLEAEFARSWPIGGIDSDREKISKLVDSIQSTSEAVQTINEEIVPLALEVLRRRFTRSVVEEK